jgi:hypothetical protein
MDEQTATDGTNPYLLTLEAWRARRGLDLQGYFALLVTMDGAASAPALCTEDCEVPHTAPWCAHGCPSLAVALELE